MQVLFLALGATRRRAVVEESAQVVADGGHAVVLISQAKPWSREQFQPEVEVVDLARLESRHPARGIEKALLFSGPRLVFRTLGRGPLSGSVRRAGKAYERRIASPVHRAFIMPSYRRAWGDLRQRLIHRHVLAEGAPFDLFVVSDPASMPPAVGLLANRAAGDSPAPRVAYSYDYAGSATGASRADRV